MSKIEFSKAVLKWSHVWTPREDCNIIERDIINIIFKKYSFRWDSEKNVFCIDFLNIEESHLNRLTFLPPLIIEDTFSCSFNFIESLEGGPIEAKKYYCRDNELRDLRGAPLRCETFICYANPLEDFRVYAEPYCRYWAANDSKLIFIDSNIWNNEEYDNNRDNIDIVEGYV